MLCVQYPSPLGQGALRTPARPASTTPSVRSRTRRNSNDQQQQQQQQQQSSFCSALPSCSQATYIPMRSASPPPQSGTMSRSRAERSLLSVLERERDRAAASASASPTSSPPQLPSAGPPSSFPPSAWPPLNSPVASRPQSRTGSRGPSRSASPVLLRDAFGFGYSPNANDITCGERELDLASLVERSIALQSSPTNTPPSSPPRATRRPYFSTSPSLSAAATIAETGETDSDSTSAHRKRAATLATERISGCPVARRPSMGSRTRSSPAQAHSNNGSLVAAPVPRRATAMAAASSLLPNGHTGVTHLSAARDPSQAYTPSNTLAVRASRAVPSARSQSPPVYPSRPLSPSSFPGRNLASQLSQVSSSTQHTLRPVISIASVASAASAQSNTSMMSAHSDSRVLTPAATPPQSSPLNPRSKQRVERSTRAISGPFLTPSMAPAEADLPFDVERAARRLRNVPGRVCFDDVALFPPSDDADDEEEAEDAARKRPRMGRRWSLW